MSEADDVRIVHFAVIDGKEKVEVLAPGDVNVSEKNGSIRSIDFRADSFSVYTIVYTVDFHYEADGEEYDFSLEGNDAISLRDLVKKLHNKFNEVDHKFKAGDYALVSIRPFDTKEALTIKLKNGESYVIDVTDAQDATMNDE